MKQIKTFVLRLLFDQAHPDQIHGSLQQVSSETFYYFHSEQALVDILRSLPPEQDLKNNDNLLKSKNDELNAA
ncbi:MAG: hypothetical protein GYA34_18020 [Chloroflexi bacterium]|nr:hypothetical protein [Chloroflexota bacterium]